jgi:hypothetical protein
MKAQVKSCMTAGVAIVGAGAIALTPIAPTPPNAYARTTGVANVDLLAYSPPSLPMTNDLVAAIQTITQGPGQSALRVWEAAFITPLRMLAIPGAIPQGPEAVQLALASLIVNLVDGPLWAADPTIDALKVLLPTLSADITNFRNNVLWQGTQDINAFLLNLLGLPDPETAANAPIVAANPLAQPIADLLALKQGLGTSALRFAEAALITPLRILDIPGAIPQGPEAVQLAVASLIVNLVDGPLWVADPMIDALKAVLPAASAGITDFRNNVLWQATQDINSTLLGILGLPDPEKIGQQPEPNNPEPGVLNNQTESNAGGESLDSVTSTRGALRSLRNAFVVGGKGVAVEDVAVKDVAVEDVVVKDVAVKDVSVKDVAVEGVVVKDVVVGGKGVAVEGVAVKDVAVKDVAVKDVAVKDVVVKGSPADSAVGTDGSAATADSDSSQSKRAVAKTNRQAVKTERQLQRATAKADRQAAKADRQQQRQAAKADNSNGAGSSTKAVGAHRK